MSQRQRLPESEAAAALELLTLREELAELALSETRLKLRVLEVQSQIASYNAARPRHESRGTEAAQQGTGPERLASLQTELADAQQELARLVAQKDALTARQQAAQKRLSEMRVGLRADADRQTSGPLWQEGKP